MQTMMNNIYNYIYNINTKIESGIYVITIPPKIITVTVAWH